MKKPGKRSTSDAAASEHPRKTGVGTKSVAGSALTHALARKKSAAGLWVKVKKADAASPAKPKGTKAGHTVKSVGGSALTQHVSARRTADGKMVRVVLAPISSGSLKRERVDLAVSKVLASRKK